MTYSIQNYKGEEIKKVRKKSDAMEIARQLSIESNAHFVETKTNLPKFKSGDLWWVR